MSITTLSKNTTLTNLDRCDRCGAQAKVRAIFTSGDLLFCAHHGRALPEGTHIEVDHARVDG